MQRNPTMSAAAPGPASDELLALQMQNRTLQILVGELLVKNERLRLALAEREPAAAINATATPPLPLQDH